MLLWSLSELMLLTASSRVTAVVDELTDRGFTLEDQGQATVARGDSTTIAGVDAPLAVVSLSNERPLTVVSTIANAAHDGYVPVLVADRRTASAIGPVLSDPFLCSEERASGRVFVPIEGRIELADGRYACVETEGAFEWYEDATEPTDDPNLVLAVGGEPVTVFDSVGAFGCPKPSASSFTYSYGRGDDGCFRVFRDGEAVGRYTGTGAMRTDGFRPVPYPLVPEHHVRDHGRLARHTVVATVPASAQTVSFQSQ
jgi:hypothetical protein